MVEGKASNKKLQGTTEDKADRRGGVARRTGRMRILSKPAPTPWFKWSGRSMSLLPLPQLQITCSTTPNYCCAHPPPCLVLGAGCLHADSGGAAAAAVSA